MTDRGGPIAGDTNSACRGSLDGDPQAETNPQPKPEALAGLLSKPVLPELQVACGERSVAGVRAGYTWTLDGNVKQLDEVWPPPGRSGSLLVSPGEDVSFVITVPPDSPAASIATESVIARLDMWDSFYANDPAGADLLSWAEDGRAIQAWLRVLDDQEVEVQSGVRAYLDGTQIEVKRAAGSWPAQQGSIFYAALGDWALVERYGPGGASLVAAKATPGGPEIVVTDIGLLYLDEPVMTPDAFAISGEVPDQYGRGDHWVYLVVRRE